MPARLLSNRGEVVGLRLTKVGWHFSYASPHRQYIWKSLLTIPRRPLLQRFVGSRDDVESASIFLATAGLTLWELTPSLKDNSPLERRNQRIWRCFWPMMEPNGPSTLPLLLTLAENGKQLSNLSNTTFGGLSEILPSPTRSSPRYSFR